MDYIMRAIKQFSEMLAALLFGARDKGENITFSELEELSFSFTGISLDTLLTLSSSQIVHLFSVTGEMDSNKVYVSARLLYQLAEQESSEEREGMLRRKAEDLLLAVYRELGGYLNDEHEALDSSASRETLKASVMFSLSSESTKPCVYVHATANDGGQIDASAQKVDKRGELTSAES